MTEKRIRANAKQTAKNLWYLDVTVEVTGEEVSSDDINILEVIQSKEKELRDDSRKLVSDEL